MSKGKIFILSASSGSGKTTLANIAIEKIKSLSRVVTMTSRAPRDGEINGVHYYFRTREEMCQINSNGGLVEMVESYGNLYGTPKFELDRTKTGTNLIIILDVYGKLKFENEYDAIGIFISPPSKEELSSRIISRYNNMLNTEIEHEYTARLERGAIEYQYAKEHGNYKYYIDGNGTIESCSNELINIILSEL